MAKKETETKVEEVKTVEPKAETVKIEVSHEDKEAFAEFLANREILAAEKKAKELAASEPKTEFEVTLRFQHNINGKRFGPGRTKCPGTLLGKLMSADQKAADRELSNMMQRDRVYKLTQGMSPVLVKDSVSR